jgi:hypothetical protein
MRLKRSLVRSAATLILTAAAFAQTLPQGVQKVASIEGVTEYAFPNGLHVLLFPDNSKPKITVNVVYLVGSRNEGYGETGMAHLLEHMTFKSSTSDRELFKDLTDRAAGNFNGETSFDQTMYFETFGASNANLRWALDLETDRMAHMTMLKKDLDTEMTVVRNEMESGENSPLNVLEERVMASAYNFHNYGKTVIGDRTDVERVPIANLATFYKKYYQPDDADLIIAGQFDESKALAMVAETIGSIPRPQRVLTQPYTAEPTQEGERSVVLRRVGNVQGVMAAYHIPAALHPDMAPLEVMAQVLGAPQTGRLYKALVDTKQAKDQTPWLLLADSGPQHEPPANETFTVRRAKRGRIQQFPIQFEVGEAILKYLKDERPICKSRFVFVTLRPPFRRVGTQTIQNMVTGRMKMLGVQSKRMGPHSLRHACATQLLRKGMSLPEIADFLGHRDLRSVSIYAKLDVRALRKVADFALMETL